VRQSCSPLWVSKHRKSPPWLPTIAYLPSKASETEASTQPSNLMAYSTLAASTWSEVDWTLSPSLTQCRAISSAVMSSCKNTSTGMPSSAAAAASAALLAPTSALRASFGSKESSRPIHLSSVCITLCNVSLKHFPNFLVSSLFCTSRRSISTFPEGVSGKDWTALTETASPPHEACTARRALRITDALSSEDKHEEESRTMNIVMVFRSSGFEGSFTAT